MKKVSLILFSFIQIYSSFCDNSDLSSIFLPEKECLIDLPISQLLKIKQSVEALNCRSPTDELDDHSISEIKIDKETNPNETEVLQSRSGALPLISDIDPRSFIHSYHHHHHHISPPWEHRPTKVQTIFQISITALSFLAFGGYLLCMIVQAIKSKGTTYLHSSSNNNGVTATPLRRIKIYRRSRRQTRRENKESKRSFEKVASPSPEELFEILKSVAEGYLKISTIEK